MRARVQVRQTLNIYPGLYSGFFISLYDPNTHIHIIALICAKMGKKKAIKIICINQELCLKLLRKCINRNWRKKGNIFQNSVGTRILMNGQFFVAFSLG